MNRKIEMYTPLRDFHRWEGEYREAIDEVLAHGRFINGPEIGELEKELAEYVEVPHCIAVSSGTDAILVALMALGVQPGDEILTVAHTWISSSEVISLIGAVPVFVDIDRSTFLMDLAKIEEKVTEKTKGILFVSLYGQMGEPEKLCELADRLGLWVIEDAAQSFGCERFGRKSCSWGQIGTTSFFPSKPLGGYGDSGACFTRDGELAKKIRAIKNHGGLERFKHQYVGINARMDTLQAAILRVKFRHFEETLEKRREIARFYHSELAGIKGVTLPYIVLGTGHAWAQYSLLVEHPRLSRDEIVEKLKEKGVMVAVFYPKGLHEQPCFGQIGQVELPETDYVCSHVLNLPLYAELEQDELDYIVETLREIF